MFCCFFFFFQAEDGIRDRTVTGVQTCALPIYPGQEEAMPRVPLVEDQLVRYNLFLYERHARHGFLLPRIVSHVMDLREASRSEERRVGKECGAGWVREQYEKKHK